MVRLICILAAFLLGSHPGMAQDAAVGPRIDYKGASLVLNGHGEREIMWISVYRCALYLSRPFDDPKKIIASRDVPKVLTIRILTDGAPAEMPDQWRKTLEAELTEPLFRRMKRGYAKASAGDELKFAYLPGQGTAFYFNGKEVFNDPGYGLMEALLDQWLGPKPVSGNLKRLLSASARP
jgi:hypothetical protein